MGVSQLTEQSSLLGQRLADLFSSKLKGKGIASELVSSSNIEGGFTLSILDSLVDKNIARMDFSLIGKFLGPRPNIEEVCTWVQNKWALKGQVEVVEMAKGFFSFAFSYDEDLRVVFAKGSWSFGCLTLVLRPWEPRMDLSKCLFHSSPIWVKLSNLPLEY